MAVARKAEADRRQQEAELQAARQEKAQNLENAYASVLQRVKTIDRVSVRRIGNSTWEAKVTVSNLWHIQRYQVRLQEAQSLWEIWARIASPRDADSARIKIVDRRGNEVGGSRIVAGSMIWVQKD